MAKPPKKPSQFASLSKLSDTKQPAPDWSPELKPGQEIPIHLYEPEPELGEVGKYVRNVGRPAGKRSNPDFKPINIILRKETKKNANRKLEDTEDPRDLSELIEELLQAWIKAE